MGVPQGRNISVTLFSIKINSLAKLRKKTTQYAWKLICWRFCALFKYKCKNMKSTERHYKIEHWAEENGFKFSKTKTKLYIFVPNVKKHPDPCLYFGNIIKLMSSNRLSCNFKVVAYSKWGADKSTFSHLYCFLDQSKLDYGCIDYGINRTS